MSRYVRWFEELGIGDVPLVGGKNASLGEMVRELGAKGVRVPGGFAVTAEAFRDALTRAGARDRLRAELGGLDKNDVAALRRAGRRCREIVYAAGLPPQAREEVLAAHAEMRRRYGEDLSLAVRSSAIAEDLPTASFAGQQETCLDVRGDEELLDAIRRCFASLFTDRAISYRIDTGFDHFRVALSVGVQKMVRSDLASAGVMFTIDTESGHPDFVFVTGAFGLGEPVVQGAVDVDEWYVHKPSYERGFRHVVRRVLGDKKIRMVLAEGRGRHPLVTRPTSKRERGSFCLSDAEVVELAGMAIAIERHYSQKSGRFSPMDIEWAKDGLDGQLYIVQARPETVVSQRKATEVEEYRLTGTGRVLVTGRAVGHRIAHGTVRVIRSTEELTLFRPAEVLVADTTTPDWEPVMKKAAPIVTNRGGRTCHAAIIARELGIPAVVGAEDATEILATGAEVTVSCAEGDVGRVYEGRVPFEVETIDLARLPRPQTRIMVNVGNPETAFRTALLPVDGVGLARLEFVFSEHVRVHPMALLHPERVQDEAERDGIRRLVRGYADPKAYFVERLSEGVATIAAAFWPRPVIVRMSDFKSNEYATLLGGRWFEPREENPMLGFRGAARYTYEAYRDGFALECAAMQRVRDGMGLVDTKLMVPFCRRLDEADRVLAFMAEQGLVPGENGLEIYVMCEIPSNVVLVDDFAKRFDGFSIGSNDLTQLVLGVDRDSPLVAPAFDERDPAVKEMLRLAIEGARRNGRKVGICGQAPSDYPEIAEFLVEHGIDSISLVPDAVLRTIRHVLEVERRLGRAPREAAA